MEKAHLFIGCSVGSLPFARAISDALQFDFDVNIWCQDTFKLNHTTLEDLMSELEDADFASFVFLPEDELNKKNIVKLSVRDNVLFEYGLFLGKLGKDRVSFCTILNAEMHLPTDLLGVECGRFQYPCKNLQSSVSHYCNAIRKQKEKLGENYLMCNKRNEVKNIIDNTNESDFYLANFGDKRSDIISKAKKRPDTERGNYDMYAINKYVDRYYYYHSDIFYKGETIESYQLALFPQLILCCLGDYRKRITELTDKYGTPINSNIDIYSFNNSNGDYTKNDDFMIGQEIMNGFKEFCYQFKYNKMVITCVLSKLKNKTKTSIYSYSITTIYEKE